MAATPSNVIPIGGTEAVGAALDRPEEAPALAQAGDADPDAGGSDGDGLDKPLLPAGCPVRALGVKGQRCWFLDVQGQLIDLGPRDYSKTGIETLFTPRCELPETYWPQWTVPKVDKETGEVIEPSKPKKNVFDQAAAAKALIGAAGAEGIFDPIGRVRGRGAHTGKAGALILHCGDKVQVSQRRVNGTPAAARWFEPGLIDGMVYPADAPAPRPALDPVGDEAGWRLYDLLKTWRWKRDELDPLLMIGFIGQAYICGALPWRSHVFVTGGRGTGKSTLNGKDGVLDQLLGKGALRTGSATEAAVRQMLFGKTIPVLFDEFEPNELNPGKTRAIIELARVASSGDDVHKGGQDHQAREFPIFSAFQFSAILMPEMMPQDRSRFAILELQPFGEGTAPLDLGAHKLPQLGRQLMRRMVDAWPRYRETFRLYADALGRAGHSARGADQYGTLLTCADLLIYDFLPEPGQVDQWAELCAPEGLAELIEADEEHEAAITHLATSSVQARGSDLREPLSAWIGDAERDVEDGEEGKHVARWKLQTVGLKLVNLRTTAAGEQGASDYRRGTPGYLAVAGTHNGVAGIFRDTRWARGAWTQALGRTPGAVRGVKVKFAGRSLRAVCVPLGEVIDLATGGEGRS